MPLGFITNESQVNTTTTGNQRSAATTALTNGGYVTVWASDSGDGSGKSIMGQLFAADGSKVGAEFLVNTTTAGDQDLPDVVLMSNAAQPGAGPANAFFVVWQSAEAGGSVIRARKFLEDGTAIRFLNQDPVDTPTTDRVISGAFDASKPSAASYGSGRVAFVFEGASGDGDGTAILMSQYVAGSFFSGVPSVVNLSTAGNQVDPRIVDSSVTGASIVWESQGPGGDAIVGRTFSQAGFFGSDAALSDAAGEDESLPNVAEGGTLVIWNSGTSIVARDFGNTLPQAQGSSFVLNTTPGGVISRSDIVGFGNGNYMAAYFTQSGDDGSSYSIRAEYFNRTDGAQATAEFLVPQSFAGAQEAPTITRLTGGNIVITWASEADALGNFEIKQRLLNLDAPAGTAGDDTIDGTAGADVLNGLAGNDTINGLGGNDIVDGGPGDDLMDGGDGLDTVTYVSATGPVTISLAAAGPQSNGDAGADTLANFENVTGSPSADVLTGTDGANVIDGGAGGDTMTGLDGDDVYYVDDVGDIVVEDSGEGTDEVRTSLASYSLVGTSLENLGAASDAAHQFRGSSVANILTGGAGSDLLLLQDGGDDTALGAGGADVLYFGSAFTGADTADGGAGIDQLVLQGNYALTLGGGVTGIESLAILPGDDTRFGDPGTNFYDYNLTTVNANVAAGVQVIVDANRLRVDEDFTFNGSAETDGGFFIWGGGGVDTLTGGSMTDIFYFGENGQFGASDFVNGGAGTDQLGLRGNYTIVFGAGQLTGIENIGMVSAQDTRFGALGTTYNYNLTLNDANLASGVLMTVDGAALRGGETLTFNGSAETNGNFRIFGGQGNDAIVTGSGNDIIQGGRGADDMTGGAGADTFRYLTALDSTVAAIDEILDFAPGTDKIDLSRIDASSLAAGDQAFSWIGSNTFTGSGAASAGELRAFESSGTWFVEGDTDGNGIADLVIAVTTVSGAALGQGDFLP
jgi:Ca2+-binding RTX toxin-like protein